MAWLLDGAGPLVAALQAAPDDLAVMTFLKRGTARPGSSGRAGSATRRPCTPSTHSRPASQRPPHRATTSGSTTTLAADGVDELLVGFWQRRTKGPRTETPYTATVSVTDGPAWRLDVSDQAPGDPAAATPRDGIPEDARPLSGTAADLYLALWNRGGTVDDPTGLLDEWRERGAVTW